MNSPIIVVGRPRSGSTLFTRILNESPDFCVINDFYYLQHVDSLGGFTRQDIPLLKDLTRYILLTLKDRQEEDIQGLAGIEFNDFLSPDKETKLINFIEQCLKQDDHNWSSIFNSIMQYNANLFNKKNWGYNTPQDYLHMPRLKQAYPEAKFIFVMRDPRSVLCSCKYLEYLEGYHDPARYHPILQALGWKSAMKSFFAHQEKDHVLFVRYEDIVKDANQVLAQVGDFVNSKFPRINIEDFGTNSTFKHKKKNKLTKTEIWLCEKIAGQEMQAAGYTLENCQPCIEDLRDLFQVTQRSLKFYLTNSFASKDIRKRVLNLAKAELIAN